MRNNNYLEMPNSLSLSPPPLQTGYVVASPTEDQGSSSGVRLTNLRSLMSAALYLLLLEANHSILI